MMTRPLNRVTPKLPAAAMLTHEMAAPLATHWRKATCEEVNCPEFLNGWMLPLAGLDDGDIWQARNSGRRYREQPTDAGPVLIYEAGQPCFRESTHRLPLDRPPLFIARDGDWRGNPRGTDPVIFSGADPFVDHFNTHMERFEQ